MQRFYRDPKILSCSTFNPVMAFIPDTLHPNFLYPEVSEELQRKTTSWMLQNDPLASGYSPKGWNCARPFGTSIILPAVYDTFYIKNHSLSNFLQNLE